MKHTTVTGNTPDDIFPSECRLVARAVMDQAKVSVVDVDEARYTKLPLAHTPTR